MPQDRITGVEAYGRYAAAVDPFLARAGGRVLFAAEPQESVIGPEHGEWDLVLAVEYPSRSAFMEMTTDAGVPRRPRSSRCGARGLAPDRLQIRTGLTWPEPSPAG